MASEEMILGNERVREHFVTAVAQRKVSHAYILEGERGSGKKLLASHFAKLLQCESRLSGERACGVCTSCVQAVHHNHPDIVWVTHEKPTVLSVAEIREQLVNTMEVKPYRGPYKIYIIDEAEKMNAAAQNALLKTIEEPPEYAVVFLLTANRGAFLDTILSRCVLLTTKPVPTRQAERYLLANCEVSEAEAAFAAEFSLGNVGKAVASVSSEDFRELKELTVTLLRGIHEIAVYEIAEQVKEYKKFKTGIDDFFDLFLMWFRDILFIRAGNVGRDVRERLIFKSEYPYLKKQADCLSLESIDAIITQTERARMRIKSNVNFEAAMELLILEAKNRFLIN